jgi:hypothetical protein
MFVRVFLLAACCAVAVFAGGQPAFSAERSGNYFVETPTEINPELIQGPENSPAKKLRKTKLVRGDLSGTVEALPLVFTDVIERNINCPDDTCTIEGIMTVQYAVEYDDNHYGICLVIDGEIPTPGCPVLGAMDGATAFASHTTTAMEYDLEEGPHKVKVQFISDQGTKLYQYNVTFNVYTRR